MANNNNDKYGGINRNLWRRVYPVGIRRQPENLTIISPDTGLTYSIDRQVTQRHRDYYKIFTLQSASVSSVVLGEYDEGLIYFDNTTSETFTYNITFTGSPIIVFTVESAASGTNPLLEGTENINQFCVWAGLNSASVGVSAEYSGTLRYRAVYNPTYPVACTSIFTSSFTCYAGTNIISNETAYTASYSGLSAINIFLQSPLDTLNDGTANVALSASSITLTEAISDISAPLNNSINWIAYQT